MDVQETIAHTRNGPQDYAGSVLTAVKARDPGQPEFHQAVSEVVRSLATDGLVVIEDDVVALPTY